MADKDLRIAFMGTPDFALPTLKALCDHYTVVCVVTKIDKPKGRGNKLTPPPVKEFALARGIPVLQPESVKTEAFVQELSSYQADLFVTCAYGKILPQSVLDLPGLGTVNVHASILPKYRGAAPLWHCVINGEQEVGVTTMYTDIGMDTGDILQTEKMPLGPDMTMGEVHDALAEMGGRLIIKTVEALRNGTLTRTPQNHAEATYAPMVSKEDGIIDWSRPAGEIHNLVRGMNPFPAASTVFNGEKLKIFVTAADMGRSAGNAAPGTVLTADAGGIAVAAGEGVVIIKELQGPSAKRMTAGAYLNGHPIKEGTVLG
jgi:methionyl-tRNA formyltransferase